MSTRAESWFAYRHVFTSAPDDFPGGGGFKTVACAAALGGERLSLIEKLVESYSNQERGGAPCRQFVPLGRGARAYALTVFTPRTDSPDDRAGNFWAETQVVPSEWLEQAGWDAAAAFEALTWLGPRNLGDLSWDLEPETLSALKPGPLDRLARLAKIVPSDCLEPLLRAIAQQSHGVRSLALLEAQGEPESHLQEVVMLLPLVVPPTSRRYKVADQFQCLTLRTRYPVGGMAFRTDITGYPASAAGVLQDSDGFDAIVVDLAGRMPTNAPEDPFGRDYAKWLQEVIQKGEWNQLEDLYKRAGGFPGTQFFANYRSLLQALSRSWATITAEVQPTAAAPARTEESELPGDETPEAAVAPPAAAPEELTITPIKDYQQESAARNDLKSALWKVRDSHRKEIEKLVGAIGEDFAADVERARAKLVKEVAGLQEGLDAKIKKLEEEAKKAEKRGVKKTERRAQPQSASPGQEPSSVEARLEALERDLAEIADRLDSLEGRTPWSFRDLLAFSRDWFRNHHRSILWGTGIGVVVLLLGFLALRGAWNIPSRWFAPDDRLAVKARTDALLPRVQPGKNAARILESVVRDGQVASWAHLETLSIALSHGIRIDGALDCALLQTSLRVPVDGNCGQGTTDALVRASKNTCCQSFQTNPSDATKFRNCFVTAYLRLEPEKGRQQFEVCKGESPWRKGQIWTDKETSSALTLFQTASNVFQGEPDSDLAKSLRDLDPTQSSSLRQRLAGETLTRDEAQRVLELAWHAWRGHQAYLEELTVGQLDDLGRFVDEIIRQGEGPPGGAEDGNTVR